MASHGSSDSSCNLSNEASEESIIYISDTEENFDDQDVLVQEPRDDIKPGYVCPDFKSGFVKELIDSDGIGILYSHQCGLALFNVNDVFENNRRVDFASMSPEQRRQTLSAEFGFVEVRFEGMEYQAISSDCILRQAGLLWIGCPPDHLQRYLRSDEHRAALQRDRQILLEKIQNREIMNVDLVRTRGKIVGYLTNDLGIIECCDNPQNRRTFVLFHVTDIFFFRSLYALERHDERLQDKIPVGLIVFFDAVSIGQDVKGVCYYACGVFVGAWPRSPHPTSLPGGPGSHSSCYGRQLSQTFYYLRTGLKESIDRRVKLFSDTCSSMQGPLHYHFSQDGKVIRNTREHSLWREENAPFRFRGPAPRGPREMNFLFSRKTPSGEVSQFSHIKAEKVKQEKN